MPYEPHFTLRSFDALGPDDRCKLVLWLVRGLVEIDAHYLRRTPDCPPLYRSGVRYRPQGTVHGVWDGVDRWWDVPMCLAMGEGSCEDLASWRVAELRTRAGEPDAKPLVHSAPKGNVMLYHIVVVRGRKGGYREEDPSALLGMRGWGGFTPPPMVGAGFYLPDWMEAA